MLSGCSDTGIRLKAEALRLGLDGCGFARAEATDPTYNASLQRWLNAGNHGTMHYLERHFDLRTDPRRLVPGARTVVSVLLNYYPHRFLPENRPRIACYAYGEDYHRVLKTKLEALFRFLRQLEPEAEGRCFVDTAPLAERYWAARAGLGFIGRNGQLIVPGKGSFFFLGEIVTTAELPPDAPQPNRCGRCTRCIDRCPAGALAAERPLEAVRCLSYQTIEHRGPLSPEAREKLGNRLYGCDECQLACPWNRFARPHRTPAFEPSEALLSLDQERLQRLTENDFDAIFARSAIRRTRYEGLMRNFEALEKEPK